MWKRPRDHRRTPFFIAVAIVVIIVAIPEVRDRTNPPCAVFLYPPFFAPPRPSELYALINICNVTRFVVSSIVPLIPLSYHFWRVGRMRLSSHRPLCAS
ncbi:hypothetical protein F4813DRAFT_41761 [Daldinia decipiens]|uniref:uncharacterized protein n=1 Tax=Daldinia decipiens TaxID=326647 RepID=UPI0020C31188|nr:uncharacterized protein F4813DRAFT_41761 [Daldinia decipiens]KAI1658679.1 hypothetical protein F4813DRAFT_41761 [Daldinia decipiens]